MAHQGNQDYKLPESEGTNPIRDIYITIIHRDNSAITIPPTLLSHPHWSTGFGAGKLVPYALCSTGQ